MSPLQAPWRRSTFNDAASRRKGRVETRTDSPAWKTFQTSIGSTTQGTGSGGGATAGANPHGGKRQAWQTEAWGYYDGLGEAHNAASLMGAAFSRIRLRVGLLDDEGEAGPLRDDEGNLVEMASQGPFKVDEALAAMAEEHVACLKDPVGGQSGLMQGAGSNLMVSGEGVLIGIDTTAENEAGELEVVDRRWEFLSSDEIKRKPGSVRPRPGETPTTPQWVRVYGDGRPDEDLPPTAYVQRIWKKHPHFSALADSSFQAVLDIMEEIVLLTRQVRAVAVSRLAGNGLLMIPSEIDFGEDPSAPEGTREHDPFTVTLIETMSESIEDRGSPASVVPMVIRADAEMIDKLRHLNLAPENENLEIAKREDAIQRFAQGIDWPVELTVGHQSTTFANAVQVTADAFRMHIEPYVAIFCGHLTAGFLWPSLMGPDGQGKPVDPSVARLVVHWDASKLIAQPDRSKVVFEAHDRLLLSNSTTLRELGFTDADAPDEAEILERIKWQILRATRESIRANEDTTIQLLPDAIIAGRGEKVQATPPAQPRAADPSGSPPSQNGA